MKSFFIVLLLAIVTKAAVANIEIQYLGNTIKYNSNPRLLQVIERLLTPSDFYWHGAALFNLEAPREEKLKREILSQLNIILRDTGIGSVKYQTVSQLRDQIEQWQVASRIPLVIDYDLARIREELNPRLDDGRYALLLPLRGFTINVIGAVTGETKLPHLATAHVSEYLVNSEVELSPYADSEFVYVIQPNGKIHKVSLGSHNNQHVEVAPGGTIYIPLRELPFLPTNEKLNDMIAKLAGSRLL